jgi:hypothetical protein
MNNVLSRVNLLTINVVGVVIALVLALILFFAMIKPKNDDVARLKADTDSTQQAGGTDDQIHGKQTELKNTQKKAVETKQNWQINEVKYMPDVDLSGDVLTTYENKLIHLPETWGKWVQAWYDVQKGQGVTLDSGGFPVESYPTDPNYVSTVNYLKFPQNGAWPVTVTARSFDAAMAHLRRFNGMHKHGVPVVDNVTLSGQSPDLLMSYTLALYIIPEKKAGAEDPFLSSTGSSAGGGGGMGGMFGGMSGGPMGGPPGMMGGAMGGMRRGGMPAAMGGPAAGMK